MSGGPEAGNAVAMPGDPTVTVERDVPCRMRDGVVLLADVYRPADAGGPLPVILMRLPYDKTQAENLAYAHPSWYARHGYVVVVQDVRGRCASEGEWYPFAHEAEDGYDTIEWAARLPGANGKVGMYGFSYVGQTQLLPAVLQPPSLVSLCPGMTASQPYEGWTYNGGALELAFVGTWTLDLAAGQARRAGDEAELARLGAALGNAAGPLRALPLDGFPPLERATTPWFFDWLDHPTYDDYWRRWSVDEDYAPLRRYPSLHIGGWYDIFLAGTVRNFLGMRSGPGADAASQRLLIGPWYHMPWVPLDSAGGEPAGAGVVDDWQLAWFDHTLRGEAFGGPDAPVSVRLMNDTRWRHYADWPPPGSTPTPLYLHSKGRANSAQGDGTLTDDAPAEAEPVDVFTYDPQIPSPSLGGQSCCYPFISPMGPVDQGPAEQWNGIVVYTGEPLAADLLLVGEASVTLWAATSAADTDWTARLCHVDPTGRSVNIKAGIVRARSRASTAVPTPITPGEAVRYEIALGPVGTRVPAGHRLRLDVASSDFPHWDRNLNSGGPLFREGIGAAVVATQTILHDADHPSCVVLPVLREG